MRSTPFVAQCFQAGMIRKCQKQLFDTPVINFQALGSSVANGEFSKRCVQGERISQVIPLFVLPSRECLWEKDRLVEQHCELSDQFSLEHFYKIPIPSLPIILLVGHF